MTGKRVDFNLDIANLDTSMGKWKLVWTDKFGTTLKRFKKKRRNETSAMLDNLDTVKKALDEGTPPGQLHAGFIHKEPKGIIAVDQSGAKGGVIQTRLYMYPNINTNELHLIIVGDKDSQQQDINACKRYVDDLRREDGHEKK